MNQFVCIHGHFYQPPRENPWLEEIEVQDSAFPCHDWNERVANESYAPNAAARILDGDGWIVQITNNYANISFNFGPTLLLWMEKAIPDVYHAIIAADRESKERFSGHGSAIAQPYNHMILPLANRRDKYTQILWGIRDFERRFGRKPAGMWLPETAVDLESLDIMAGLGIEFTILAPHQASRVRPIGTRQWRDVTGARIDPTQPYLLRLPSGRQIVIFFYDGPISRAIAFEDLLQSGERFAGRLLDAFEADRVRPQLVHVATDGETYGHHQRHGDMALAYALHYIAENGLAQITNYAEHLERFPPKQEVEIFEYTSWSCAHGVERWRSDCGCNTGGQPNWNQAWREPLRDALDWLRDALAGPYEELAAQYLRDPWKARDDYIDFVLFRSRRNLGAYLERHALRALTDEETVRVLKLLELQRHAMLMYTSCGWFFSELSGIETVQVIQYAGRAVQLAEDLFGDSVEEQFLERLALAKSNIAEHQDGRVIYEKFVRPARVDLAAVAAHYAVSSLFESYPSQARIFCYRADLEDVHALESGTARLTIGRVKITSVITFESATFTYAVLHLGDHNLSGGVRPYEGPEAYAALGEELQRAFEIVDFAAVVRVLDANFKASTYSLRSLFRDEQRRVLDRILAQAVDDAEARQRDLLDHHGPLMRFLTEMHVPIPGVLRAVAGVVVNADLREQLQSDTPERPLIERLLQTANDWQVQLEAETLAYTLEGTITRLAHRFRSQPSDARRLDHLDTAADLARVLPFETDLWEAQNSFYQVLHSVFPEMRAKAERGDHHAVRWVEQFRALGEKLRVRVD